MVEIEQIRRRVERWANERWTGLYSVRHKGGPTGGHSRWEVRLRSPDGDCHFVRVIKTGLVDAILADCHAGCTCHRIDRETGLYCGKRTTSPAVLPIPPYALDTGPWSLPAHLPRFSPVAAGLSFQAPLRFPTEIFVRLSRWREGSITVTPPVLPRCTSR